MSDLDGAALQGSVWVMHEVLAIRAFEYGYLRLILSYRIDRGSVGVSAEVQGRAPENRWDEVLRVDCYVGNVHCHMFPRNGHPTEHALSGSCDDLAGAVALGTTYLRDGLAEVVEYLGYPRSAQEARGAGGVGVLEWACKQALAWAVDSAEAEVTERVQDGSGQSLRTST